MFWTLITVLNLIIFTLILRTVYYVLFTQPKQLGGGIFTMVPQNAGQFVVRGRRLDKFIPGNGTSYNEARDEWTMVPATKKPWWDLGLSYVSITYLVGLTRVLIVKFTVSTAELVEMDGSPVSVDRLKPVESDHFRFVNIIKWTVKDLECADGSTIESVTFQWVLHAVKPVFLVFNIGNKWPDKAGEFVQAAIIAVVKNQKDALTASQYIGTDAFVQEVKKWIGNNLTAVLGLELSNSAVTNMTLNKGLSDATNSVVENRQKALAKIEEATGDAEALRKRGDAEAHVIAQKALAEAQGVVAKASAYNGPGGEHAARVDAMNALGKTTGTVILDGRGIVPTIPIGGSKPPTTP